MFMKKETLYGIGVAACIAMTAALAKPVGPADAVAMAPSPAPVRPAAFELLVVADDYTFDAPARVPAGRVALRLVNRGREIHHVQLVRLAEGRTLADLQATLAAGDAYPAWATDMGGPNAAAPGGEVTASLDLEPGRYAVLCLIPSPDGVLHVMKGMSRELVVEPATEGVGPSPTQEGAGPAEPEPDVELVLGDYAFAFSEPLSAGTQRIRISNVAPQSHEIAVFRLEPGRSAMDVVHWIEAPEGPPPGLPVGGVTGIARGVENDLTLTLEPGRYALICFLPDAGDGRPHFVHGMIREIEIPAAAGGR